MGSDRTSHAIRSRHLVQVDRDYLAHPASRDCLARPARQCLRCLQDCRDVRVVRPSRAHPLDPVGREVLEDRAPHGVVQVFQVDRYHLKKTQFLQNILFFYIYLAVQAVRLAQVVRGVQVGLVHRYDRVDLRRLDHRDCQECRDFQVGRVVQVGNRSTR